MSDKILFEAESGWLEIENGIYLRKYSIFNVISMSYLNIE